MVVLDRCLLAMLVYRHERSHPVGSQAAPATSRQQRKIRRTYFLSLALLRGNVPK
jgi:hypothetical protein